VKKILFISVFQILVVLMSSSQVNMDLIYSKKPDIKNSFEGVLNEPEKKKALDYMNKIRNLHGLEPVTYNAAGDIFTAKASLIMAANNTLTHNPDSKMKCWSKEGAEGASKSNLAINYYSDLSMIPTSESFFDIWLKDTDVDSLGHRRWLLDPFLKHISFGRVDGSPLVKSEYYVSASALLVVNNEQGDITGMKTDFVAYPYENYPSGLFDGSWYLSFSVIGDRENKWNGSVSFKGAAVEIKTDKNVKLAVTSRKEDYNGFGLPNIIMWKTPGLKENVRYNVSIKNVEVKGEKKDYNYFFSLIGD
jgi:uncharacterized protein YkwD